MYNPTTFSIDAKTVTFVTVFNVNYRKLDLYILRINVHFFLGLGVSTGPNGMVKHGHVRHGQTIVMSTYMSLE